MNTLSWLIYAGEVLPRLVQVTLGLSFGGLFLTTFGGFVATDSYSEFVEKGFSKYVKRFLISGLLFAVVAIFVPSSRTIYMIAASEVGETVVASPDAIEMMGDIKAIIKKRLKEELGE